MKLKRRKLRNFCAAILAGTCALLCLAPGVQAAEVAEPVLLEQVTAAETADGTAELLYTEKGEKAIVVGYTRCDTEVLEIPSEWNGYPIAKITKDALCGAEFQEVVIPASVIEIEAGAFAECRNLRKITVAEGNRAYFTQNNLLMDLSGTVLLCCPCQYDQENIEIPDTVRVVASYAMANCVNLRDISFSDQVNRISSQACSGCSALESVSIGKNLVTLGAYAFFNCPNLHEVWLPDTLHDIHSYALGYSSTEITDAMPDVNFLLHGQRYTVAEAYAQMTGLTFVVEPSEQEEETESFAETSDLLLEAAPDAEDVPVVVLAGDVNGDAAVTLTDVVMAMRYYMEHAIGKNTTFPELGSSLPEPVAFQAADCNQDGSLTLEDITTLVQGISIA